MKESTITLQVSKYSKMVRTMRLLEQKNDKLNARIKAISEILNEPQTRSTVYNKRAQPPSNRRIQRGYGKPLPGRDTGQILRGDKPLLVDGVQIPTKDSVSYKPQFRKIASKIKSVATKMVK